MKKHLPMILVIAGVLVTLFAIASFFLNRSNLGDLQSPVEFQSNAAELPTEFSMESAKLCSDFSIVLDGTKVYFKNLNGDAAYPILYKESTYLPLRAVGNLMGKNVNWDEQNKIVDISGVKDTVKTDVPNENIGRQDIIIQERSDFTIRIDNNEKTFYSGAGEIIYPILYNGSTYLPLRTIGEIMNKEVSWDSRNKTVILSGSLTVTDADSFNSSNGNTNNNANNNQSGSISLEDAKKAAINHAGLSESQVTFGKTKTDYENNRLIYEIEFFEGHTEYDYEIDANTGQIIKYEKDTNYNGNAVNGNNENSGNSVSLEDAKTIALNHAGVNASNAIFKKAEMDYENGLRVYEIEFRSGRKEYEYEIDADSGKIIKFESDYDD